MFKKFAAAIAVVAGTITGVYASFNPVSLEPYGAPLSDYYSSVVALRMHNDKGSAACTGTLVHDLRSQGHDIGFVLTAAHCVQDAKTVQVGYFPEGYDGKGYGIIREAKNWRWPTSFSDLHDNSGSEIGMNMYNAHRYHDWAVVMVKGLPSHVRSMPISTPWNPDGTTPTNTVFLVARDSQDKHSWISPLYAVPFNLTMRFGLPDSKVWQADVAQPLDPNGLRGLCMGNSGGPVVTVVDGRPILIGIASAESGSFPVIGEKKSFKCGTDAYWYNATLATTDIWAAINQSLIDEGVLKPEPTN
jgi:hypothetical protein